MVIWAHQNILLTFFEMLADCALSSKGLAQSVAFRVKNPHNVIIITYEPLGSHLLNETMVFRYKRAQTGWFRHLTAQSFLYSRHCFSTFLQTMSKLPPNRPPFSPLHQNASQMQEIKFDPAGNPFCRDHNGQWVPYCGPPFPVRSFIDFTPPWSLTTSPIQQPYHAAAPVTSTHATGHLNVVRISLIHVSDADRS